MRARARGGHGDHHSGDLEGHGECEVSTGKALTLNAKMLITSKLDKIYPPPRPSREPGSRLRIGSRDAFRWRKSV